MYSQTVCVFPCIALALAWPILELWTALREVLVTVHILERNVVTFFTFLTTEILHVRFVGMLEWRTWPIMRVSRSWALTRMCHSTLFCPARAVNEPLERLEGLKTNPILLSQNLERLKSCSRTQDFQWVFRNKIKSINFKWFKSLTWIANPCYDKMINLY